MTANTAQRVDVERLRPVSVFEVQPSLPSMEPHPFGAYVRHSDYAALLLQVAELRTSRDAYKHDAEALLQITNGARGALEAAERAREEACGLLREANEWVSGYSITSEFRKRIASFLAANSARI